MALGKGRGKLVYADIKKDDGALAGPNNTSTSCNPEQSMDDYLKKINMYRKPVAKDGSCLFRVVSEQVFFTQALHQKVRGDCIKYMHEHRDIFESFIEGSFEHHLFNLRNLKEWGGHSEMTALSLLYKYDFIVYQLANTTPQDVTKNGFEKKIHLCYLNNNHYDSVYPVNFKTSAAIAQSIVYEVLLGNVFAEVDKREMEESKTEYVEEVQTSGWTEVKTKQNKGKNGDNKSSDDPWEHLLSVIPESTKNSRVHRSLKASLDPSVYRNIELDVWETTRTEQQKIDHVIAATYQFKQGDVCMATIRESKDVSKQVVVRVQKISTEKCIVMPEDKDIPYYVQLDDLQPLVNGDLRDYRSLPGYYNKYDNEQEFQSQKRRKHGRKARDEERKCNETNLNQPKGRTDNRVNRRNGARKDKQMSPLKQTKEAVNQRKADKSETTSDAQTPTTPTLTNTSADDAPAKVAQPAETSAAFWGRMRSTAAPTSNTSAKITTTATTPKSPTPPQQTRDDAFKAPVTKPESSPTQQETPVLSKNINQTGINPNNTPNNGQPKENTPQVKKPINSIKLIDDVKIRDAEESIPSVSESFQKSDCFTLTTQDSAIVNKVRENIISLTTNQAECDNIHNATSSEEQNQGKIPTTNDDNEISAKPEKEKVKKSAEPSDFTNGTQTNVEKIISEVNKISLENPEQNIHPTIHNGNNVPLPNDVSGINIISDHDAHQKSPKVNKTKKKVSFGTTTEIVEKSQPVHIPSTIAQQPELQLSLSSERGKIHIPRDHIEKHMNPVYPVPPISTPYQGTEMNPQMPEFQQQQQQQHVRFIQPTFVQGAHPTSFYQQTPQVFPIVYRQNDMDVRTTIPTLSQDPEGKDLPEDINVLRYFYNLGLQYYWMTVSQPNLQVNQPGLLPLPVATPIQQMPVQQLVTINSDHNRNTEVYVPNAQTNEGLLELHEQQLPTSSNILHTRIPQQQPQFHHSHPPQNASFEEYETPPRLRRGLLQQTGVPTANMVGAPMNHRNLHRHHTPRHVMNGRGIMGQGPKILRGDQIRTQNYP